MAEKLKFLIIGPKTDNTKDLVDVINSIGHGCLLIEMKEIYFSYDHGKFLAVAQEQTINEFDIIIFRAFNINLNEARILANVLLKAGKTVIDEKIGQDFVPGKVYEASCLARAGLNHPQTLQFVGSKANYGKLDELKYPVVVKPIDGQKGQGIVKYTDASKVEKHLEDNPQGYLIQEYLLIESDFRVMVVGGQAIGAIERIVPEGEFRSNTSLGAESRKADITPEMEKIAVAAAQALGFEVAGVDMARSGGEWYVLEVNHTPQWQNVKKLCGINPAEYIIDYAIKKYEQA